MDIKEDVSFYQRCKNYLNVTDPEGYNYYSMKQAIESYIKMEVDLNMYIMGNIFGTNADCYETPEEVSDVLKNTAAAVYMILEEKSINLDICNNLIDALYTCLNNAVGVEISDEVFDFLKNYEK